MEFYIRGYGVRRGRTLRNIERMLWNRPGSKRNVLKKKLEKKNRRQSRKRSKR